MEIPNQVADLIGDTRIKIEKLLAAWPGLSTETQIQILAADNFIEAVPNWRETEKQRLLKFGVENENEYVRYRVIEVLGSSSLSPEVKRQVSEDTTFVTSTRYLGWDLTDIELVLGLVDEDFGKKFWNQPHLTRLAWVKNGGRNENKCLKLVAQIALYVIENFNEDEEHLDDLWDLLNEFINNEWFVDRYTGDFWDKYNLETNYDPIFERKGWEQGYRALWRLIPIATDRIATLLLSKLPVYTGVESEEEHIPFDVLRNLTRRQIELLLSRADVQLEYERRWIIFQFIKQRGGKLPTAVWERVSLPNGEPIEIFNPEVLEHRSVRLAAITSNHFRFSYSDFSYVLKLPNEGDKMYIIRLLLEATTYAPIFWECKHQDSSCDPHRISFERQHSVRHLSVDERERQRLHLQIYKLAALVHRDNQSVPEHLFFIESEITAAEDTWNAFLNACEAWVEREKNGVGNFFHDFELERIQTTVGRRIDKFFDPKGLLLLEDYGEKSAFGFEQHRYLFCPSYHAPRNDNAQ